jgi:hypothetical protein
MQKSGLVFLLLSFCPLLFGQTAPNSITVSASQNASLQADQAVFAVTIQSPVSTGLEDVIAALQGSGITAASFAGVSTQPGICNALNCTSIPPATLLWAFALPAPLTNTKATVASLTTLQQNIAKANNGLALSFSIAGTQVSQQLAQSQTCSLAGLIASATAQAQNLAAAANLTAGRILAISSGTATGISNSGVLYAGLSSVYVPTNSAVPPLCAITVKFALAGY